MSQKTIKNKNHKERNNYYEKVNSPKSKSTKQLTHHQNNFLNKSSNNDVGWRHNDFRNQNRNQDTPSGNASVAGGRTSEKNETPSAISESARSSTTRSSIAKSTISGKPSTTSKTMPPSAVSEAAKSAAASASTVQLGSKPVGSIKKSEETMSIASTSKVSSKKKALDLPVTSTPTKDKKMSSKLLKGSESKPPLSPKPTKSGRSKKMSSVRTLQREQEPASSTKPSSFRLLPSEKRMAKALARSRRKSSSKPSSPYDFGRKSSKYSSAWQTTSVDDESDVTSSYSKPRYSSFSSTVSGDRSSKMSRRRYGLSDKSSSRFRSKRSSSRFRDRSSKFRSSGKSGGTYGSESVWRVDEYPQCLTSLSTSDLDFDWNMLKGFFKLFASTYKNKTRVEEVLAKCRTTASLTRNKTYPFKPIYARHSESDCHFFRSPVNTCATPFCTTTCTTTCTAKPASHNVPNMYNLLSTPNHGTLRNFTGRTSPIGYNRIPTPYSCPKNNLIQSSCETCFSGGQRIEEIMNKYKYDLSCHRICTSPSPPPPSPHLPTYKCCLCPPEPCQTTNISGLPLYTCTPIATPQCKCEVETCTCQSALPIVPTANTATAAPATAFKLYALPVNVAAAAAAAVNPVPIDCCQVGPCNCGKLSIPENRNFVIRFETSKPEANNNITNNPTFSQSGGPIQSIKSSNSAHNTSSNLQLSRSLETSHALETMGTGLSSEIVTPSEYNLNGKSRISSSGESTSYNVHNELLNTAKRVKNKCFNLVTLFEMMKMEKVLDEQL